MKNAPHILLCSLFLSLFAVDSQAFEMDSTIYKRLRKIEKNVCLDLNEDVQNAIHDRIYGNRNESELVLSRSLEMLPQIEKQLYRYNLPAELKYLPVALSDLNPLQTTPNGGSGLWNLQYITGRRYGLLINEYVDERRDVVKSTAAAMLYLTDLNNIYHNWSYSILAFMSSPSEVNAAIRRAGGLGDFWSVFRQMDDPGKYGFCRFVAADFLLNYYKEYDLQRKPALPAITVKTFTVDRPIHIADLASRLGVTEADIRMINPLFRGDVIPAGHNFSINIPITLVPRYEALKDTLPLSVASANNTSIEPVHNFYFDEKTYKDEKTVSVKTTTVTTTDKLYHKVASGENLFKISAKYKCSVDEIKQWNNLKNDIIYAGQKLEIRKEVKTTTTTEVPVKTTTETTTTQPVETEVKTTPPPVKETTTTEKKTTTTSSKTDGPTWIVYKVKSGDSVWRIANKFHITEETLRKNNKLKGNTIHPGQVLKIKKKD